MTTIASCSTPSIATVDKLPKLFCTDALLFRTMGFSGRDGHHADCEFAFTNLVLSGSGRICLWHC